MRTIKNHLQKILRVISDSNDEIDPSEDPFDREIESLPNSNVPNITDPLMEKTNVYCSMKVIFQDHSGEAVLFVPAHIKNGEP